MEREGKIAHWNQAFKVLALLCSTNTRSSKQGHSLPPPLPTTHLSPHSQSIIMIAPRALLCLALPALAAAFVGRAPTTVTRASAPVKGRTVLMESISDFLKFDAKLGELEVTKAGV